MNNNYKRTFDSVRMKKAHQERMRSELSSFLSTKIEEDNTMNTKQHSIKRSRIFVIAAIVVLTFTLVGFTFGNQIIQLLGGGRIEQGKNSDGEDFVSIDTGFVEDPIKVQDGQIYFILDGYNTNITDYCSDETYYEYEKISDNGYRHVVLIGGTPDNVGMAEFVFDEEGKLIGSNASLNSQTEPMWLKSGRAKLLEK